MSLREYECSRCDNRFEVLSQKTNDYKFAECPRCGQTAELVMSACSFSFGWRLTEKSHLPGNKDEIERNI